MNRMQSPLPIAIDPAPVHSLHDALRVMLGNASTTNRRGTDGSVHAARKEMKRARAALRLMRASLGDTAYRTINRQVRDAARPLTPIRDARVLIHSLELIRRPGDKKARKAYFNYLHDLLNGELRSSHRQLTAAALDGSAAVLRKVEQRIEALPAKEPDLPIVKQGMRRVFKAGRAAQARARRRPNTDSLHEWRKQTKYLSNQIELIRALFQVKLKKIGRRSYKLAELLGEDHDLALLGDKLGELRAAARLPPSAGARRILNKRIKRRRCKLQAKARRLGKRLYGRSAGRFASALARSLH
jgi:CHAD domain-containing protein